MNSMGVFPERTHAVSAVETHLQPCKPHMIHVRANLQHSKLPVFCLFVCFFKNTCHKKSSVEHMAAARNQSHTLAASQAPSSRVATAAALGGPQDFR